MKTVDKVNIQAKFDLVQEYWKPKIIGELNQQYVKIVRFKGPFVFHKHESEDEMFLVLKGHMKMELEDKTLGVEAGEFIIIPRGVMHKPVAEEETEVMLFEPATTLNTGNTRNAFTVNQPERI